METKASQITDCQQNIFGCDSCTLNSSTEKFSCNVCQSNFYLYRLQQEDRNICVRDCALADSNTINDEEMKQCVFLGYFCTLSGTRISTTSGQDVTECTSTLLQNQGYVLASRDRFLTYLNSLDEANPPDNTTMSVADFKGLKKMYANPVSESEANQKVEVQCLNKYCSICDDLDLSQCITCKGRFSNQARFNMCLSRTTCNVSPGTDDSFKNGCFQTSSDCMSCDVCDMGFVRQEPFGRCFDCSNIDNCKECSGQQTNGDLRCEFCRDGFGIDLSDNNKCRKCVKDSKTKSCEFDSSGVETIKMCVDGFLASSDGQKCVERCDQGEHKFSTYRDDITSITSIGCKSCHSSCASCSDAGSDHCISCTSGKYLLTSPGNSYGECVQKQQSSEVSRLLVLNQLNQPFFDQLNITYPLSVFKSLHEALLYAYKLTTPFQGLRVEIMMEPGEHFILKSIVDDFRMTLLQEKAIDLSNLQFHLSIGPSNCDDPIIPVSDYPNSVQFCKTKTQMQNEPPSVVILNKVNNYFQIQVPLSLSVQGILFESLDSVLPIQAPNSNLPTAECKWDHQVEKFYPFCGNSQSLVRQFNESQICKLKKYESLFQMRQNQVEVVSKDQIQSLKISNCWFQNFFYEMGSLVRVPDSSSSQPYSVSITDSSFTNMSFCGSIVSNLIPQFEGDLSAANQRVLDGIARQIKQRYSDQGWNKLDCSNEECQQVVFQNNSVDSLFKFKTLRSQEYFGERVNWQMRHLGLVLSLHNFTSNIRIVNNRISNISLNFSDFCQLPGDSWTSKSKWTKSDGFIEYLKSIIPFQDDTYQTHSIFYLHQESSNRLIQIENNTFEKIRTSNSLIQISKLASTSQNLNDYVLLKDNKFFQSSSYIGANIATITFQDRQTNAHLINPYCLNAQVSGNIVRTALGDCQVDTGFVRIQCNNSALAEEKVNDSFINNTRMIGYQVGEQAEKMESGSWTNLSDNWVDGSRVGNQQGRLGENGEWVSETGSGQMVVVSGAHSIRITNNSFSNISSYLPASGLLQVSSHGSAFIFQLNFTQSSSRDFQRAGLIELNGQTQTLEVERMFVEKASEIRSSLLRVESRVLQHLRISNSSILNCSLMSGSSPLSTSLLLTSLSFPNSANISNLKLSNLHPHSSYLDPLFINSLIQLNASHIEVSNLEFSNSLISQSFTVTPNDSFASSQTTLFHSFSPLQSPVSLNKMVYPSVRPLISLKSSVSTLIQRSSFANLTFGSNLTLRSQSNQEQLILAAALADGGSLIDLEVSSAFQKVDAKQLSFTNITYFANRILHDQANNQIDLHNMQATYPVLITANHRLPSSPNLLGSQVQLETIFISNSFNAMVESVLSLGAASIPFGFGPGLETLSIKDIRIGDLKNQMGDEGEGNVILYFNCYDTLSSISISDSLFAGNQSAPFQSNLSRPNSQAFQSLNAQQRPKKRLLEFTNCGSPSTPVTLTNISLSEIDLSSQNLEGSIIKVTNSSLLITRAVFNHLKLPLNGSILKLDDNNSITLLNSSITNITSLGSGVVLRTKRDSPFPSQLFIKDSTISRVSALSSSLFSVFSNSTRLSIANSQLTLIQAQQDCPIGTFSNSGFESLSISDSQIINNIASTGQGLICLKGASASISNSIFTDNLAKSKTFGLLITSQNQQESEQTVNLTQVQFSTSVYAYQSQREVFGSYIHIQSDSVNLRIVDSFFKMGAANLGGAIYGNLSRGSRIKVQVTNSRFFYNRALRDGGAIYFDGLQLYDISVSNCSFQDNIGSSQGDNLFFRQISPFRQSTNQNSERSLREVENKVEIASSEFSTPVAYNQIYAEGLEQFTILNSDFSPTKEYKAFEGASLYIKDVFQVLIQGNVFTEQNSIVRGGAVMLKQTRNLYLGEQPFESGTGYTLADNQFFNCSSQQGGAIYFHQVRLASLTASNTFQNNQVIYYNQTSPFYGSNLPLSTSSNSETKLTGSLNFPFLRGKGPALFFECSLIVNCSFQISNSTSISQSSIIYVKDGVIQKKDTQEDGIAKAIFFTDVNPSLPQSLIALSQSVMGSGFTGTKAGVMTNLTQYQEITSNTKLLLTFDSSKVTQFDTRVSGLVSLQEPVFLKFFDMQEFSTKQSFLFGDSYPVAIVDDSDKVQIHDYFSSLSLSILNTSLSQKSQEQLNISTSMRSDVDLRWSNFFTFTAQGGIINVPKIFLRTIPGSIVNLALNVEINRSDAPTPLKLKNIIQVKTMVCKDGEVLNDSGFCDICDGPNFYLTDQTNFSSMTNQCKICDDNVFTCLGGLQIMAKKGYQKVFENQDVFVRCPSTGSVERCLEDNKCLEGYMGLTCSQCQKGYYRSIDGHCQECRGDGSVRAVLGCLWVVMLSVGMGAVVFKQSKSQGEVSLVLFLIKNFITYSIFISLLSQLSLHLSQSDTIPQKIFSQYLQIFKFIYSFPLSIIPNVQCGESKEEGHKVFKPIQLAQKDPDFFQVERESIENVDYLRVGVLIHLISSIVLFLILTVASFLFSSSKQITCTNPIKIEQSTISKILPNPSPEIDPHKLSPIKFQSNQALEGGEMEDGDQEERKSERIGVAQVPSLNRENNRLERIQAISDSDIENYPSSQRHLIRVTNYSPVKLTSLNIPSQQETYSLQTMSQQNAPNSISRFQVFRQNNSSQSKRLKAQPQLSITHIPRNHSALANPQKSLSNLRAFQSSILVREPQQSLNTFINPASNLSELDLQTRKALKSELMKNLEHHLLSPPICLIMSIGFIVATQISEVTISLFVCSEVDYSGLEGFKMAQSVDQQLVSKINPFLGIGTHLTNNTSSCFGDIGYIVAASLWAGVWLIVSPLYLIAKTKRQFIIEVMGIWVKVAMVALSKVLVKSEFSRVLGASILLSLQTIVYLVFRNGQIQSESQKTKLRDFIFSLDLLMYLLLTLTSFINIVQISLSPDSEQIYDGLTILLLIIHFSYIALFFWKATRIAILEIGKERIKFILLMVFKCKCFAKSDELLQDNDLATKQKEAEEEQIEKQLEKQQVDKIDLLIHHLRSLQRNPQVLQDRSDLARVAEESLGDGISSRRTNVLSLHLNSRKIMHDIQSILFDEEDLEMAENFQQEFRLDLEGKIEEDIEEERNCTAEKEQPNNSFDFNVNININQVDSDLRKMDQQEPIQQSKESQNSQLQINLVSQSKVLDSEATQKSDLHPIPAEIFMVQLPQAVKQITSVRQIFTEEEFIQDLSSQNQDYFVPPDLTERLNQDSRHQSLNSEPLENRERVESLERPFCQDILNLPLDRMDLTAEKDQRLDSVDMIQIQEMEERQLDQTEEAIILPQLETMRFLQHSQRVLSAYSMQRRPEYSHRQPISQEKSLPSEQEKLSDKKHMVSRNKAVRSSTQHKANQRLIKTYLRNTPLLKSVEQNQSNSYTDKTELIQMARICINDFVQRDWSKDLVNRLNTIQKSTSLNGLSHKLSVQDQNGQSTNRSKEVSFYNRTTGLNKIKPYQLQAISPRSASQEEMSRHLNSNKFSTSLDQTSGKQEILILKSLEFQPQTVEAEMEENRKVERGKKGRKKRQQEYNEELGQIYGVSRKEFERAKAVNKRTPHKY